MDLAFDATGGNKGPRKRDFSSEDYTKKPANDSNNDYRPSLSERVFSSLERMKNTYSSIRNHSTPSSNNTFPVVYTQPITQIGENQNLINWGLGLGLAAALGYGLINNSDIEYNKNQIRDTQNATVIQQEQIDANTLNLKNLNNNMAQLTEYFGLLQEEVKKNSEIVGEPRGFEYALDVNMDGRNEVIEPYTSGMAKVHYFNDIGEKIDSFTLTSNGLEEVLFSHIYNQEEMNRITRNGLTDRYNWDEVKDWAKGTQCSVDMLRSALYNEGLVGADNQKYVEKQLTNLSNAIDYKSCK